MIPDFLTQPPSADPTDILRMRDGLYAVDLLGAALSEFALFDRLAEAPASLEGLCARLGIQPRPADVMLTLFAAMNLVESRGGLYHTTPAAREFLVRTSPLDLGPYYLTLKDRPVCRDFIQVLRTGKPARWGSFTDQEAWTKAMETEAFARSFTAAMDCRGRILGPTLARKLDLTGHRHLLDIAGGSGVYACACAATHPHLRATILEKPPVNAIAREAAANAGLADRVEVRTGDMFRDPWPRDCDVHLFSNVLHDWDVPEVRSLLDRSFGSLPPGGLLVIHDAFLNREKTGPLPVAMYSALLMNISEGRCYGVGEMEELLARTGFVEPTWTPTVADRSFMTARKLS